LEAEKAVLGAAMMEPRVIEEVNLRPDDFYQPAHEQLWALIVAEHRSGRPVTPLALTQHLVPRPIPGIGAAYLHECVEASPAAAAAEYYAGVITGLARIRRMADVGRRLLQESATAAWDAADTVLDQARAVLDETVAESTGVKVRTFAQALEAAINEWESPKERGFPTGWSDLDRKLNGGWRPGQLTVIGARPAVGKSVIASCAAVAAAGYGVGFFSLEMSETEVVGRMAAAAQGIKLSNISAGELTDGDWQKLARLAHRSQQWPVYIEDRSRLTMAQIAATVRTWRRRGPLPLVIIDYSQLVTPADRSESRERQVSRILEDCKHLAKEFNTHVLALAQVNRGSTQRENKRPTEADLRESGGIEAHADNIILLHRDEKEFPDEIELIVAKNRHGETGTIRLVWRPSFASANSMASGPEDYRYGMEAVS
jgi:replicative DNA helicase